MKLGLVIIDVQNDYFEGGNMMLENTVSTLNNVIRVKRYFEQHHLPVFLIQHLKEKDAPFFKKDSFGAEIHPDIFPIQTTNHLVVKQYPNSFFQTDLQEKLNDEHVEKVVIVGMMTHMCVDSTTRAAKELDYDPILLSDACTTKKLNFNSNIVSSQDVQHAYFSALTNFADVMDTSTFLKNQF